MSIAHQDVNTYNEDGRIIQVEYAMKAINLGTTTIGARLSDCAIIVSEKKLISPLQNSTSIKKHFKIYDNIMAGISGISGDAGPIIDKCRSICISHEQKFNEQIPTERLMEKICALALKFGENDMEKKIFSRPFGVSLLVASWENGPKLYSIDPSGSYLSYKARTIGSAQEVVDSVLEKEYNPNMQKEQGIRWILSLLKNVMKEKLNENNVEVSVVDASGVEILTPKKISILIK